MIVVLWLALIMTSLALSFGQSARMDIQAASHYSAGRESTLANEGMLNYFKLIVKQATSTLSTPDSALYECEAVVIGNAKSWVLGRNSNEQDHKVYHYGLVDEASKLNINTATKEMLLKLPGIDESQVDAIIDWRDKDDATSNQGAESSYYLSLTPAYSCKNAAFESLYELKMLRSIDLSMIYGEDFNLNGVLNDNEDNADSTLPNDNQDGQLNLGLLEYLTLFTSEPNTRMDGSERIEIDEMNAMRNHLVSTFGDERGAELFNRIGNVAQIKSLLELALVIGITPEEYTTFIDGISMPDQKKLEGLVNILSAPIEVLICLPGMTTDFAEQIISFRTQNSDRNQDILWLDELLGRQMVIALGPYITHTSRTYSADIVSLGKQDKGLIRTYFVIQSQADDVKLLWRENRSHLGWPLAQELREVIH